MSRQSLKRARSLGRWRIRARHDDQECDRQHEAGHYDRRADGVDVGARVVDDEEEDRGQREQRKGDAARTGYVVIRREAWRGRGLYREDANAAIFVLRDHAVVVGGEKRVESKKN